jgi:predicted transcriptional regulator
MSADKRLEMTADIVAAYVANNHLPRQELAALIETLHAALTKLGEGSSTDASRAPAEPLTPAVPIKKSVSDDFIVCLEDGKKFKSLKRHLTLLGMTPEQYRTRWGLPPDYPMVAANYAKTRSELAKTIGLGRKAKGRPKGSAKATAGS